MANSNSAPFRLSASASSLMRSSYTLDPPGTYTCSSGESMNVKAPVSSPLRPQYAPCTATNSAGSMLCRPLQTPAAAICTYWCNTQASRSSVYDDALDSVGNAIVAHLAKDPLA